MILLKPFKFVISAPAIVKLPFRAVQLGCAIMNASTSACEERYTSPAGQEGLQADITSVKVLHPTALLKKLVVPPKAI